MNYSKHNEEIRKMLNEESLRQMPTDDISKIAFLEDFIIKYHKTIKDIKIDKLWTQKNLSYNHYNFYIDGYVDGVYDTNIMIGLSTSAKKEENPNKRLYAAMREANSADTIWFKQEWFKMSPFCKICKKELESIADSHLDHCGKKEFRHIADEFLKSNPKPNLKLAERDKNDNSIPKLEDNEDKEKWKEHHEKEAKYQLLCKTCNLRKEKK
jgi:hypothetical protein